MKRLFLLFLIVFGLVAHAQDGQETQGGEQAPPTKKEADLDRLRSVAPSLAEAKKVLQSRIEAVENATTDLERKELEEQVDEQRAIVKELRMNFQSLASGVDEETFLGVDPPEGGLQESLETILEPISRSVREATEGPRELEDLKRKLQESIEQRSLAEDALERIDALEKIAEQDVVREELATVRALWQERHDRAAGQVKVFEQQIEIRTEAEVPAFQKVSNFFSEFWKSKGLNLVLAILACIGAVILTREIYKLIRRYSPLHKKSGLTSRTLDLLVNVLTTLIAIGAVILVFYLRGDWLLLALCILLLVGLLWASKTAIPPYLEQIRLILNLGPVREGERIVIDGVPWRVRRLNFQCYFVNPELSGGILRLPIRDVMPLHSRPADSKEPWFPTKEDHWVVLADDTYGKVVEQTPEQVVVLRLGGSRKTYSTADFLGQTPENLSRGFRINSTFGIDYNLQPISTDKVPEGFCQHVEKVLYEKFGHDLVRSVKVEFASAGASSLDYQIIADFDGELASRKNVIERLLQSACVDVCNREGWSIPFTQITVHQAEAGDPVVGTHHEQAE